MQHLGDERQTPTAVLAGVHELLYLIAQFGSRIVANQTPRATQNISVAQVVDLGLDFFYSTPEADREPRGIKDRGWIAVKEHQNIPRQK